MNRTKNASRNMLFGIILKVYQIIVPFLMRTAMIYFLGMQYLGLSSLFASILQVLNLAELGVGSAMVYGMYKPISESDEKTICALLKLYKIYYRIIGLVIAVIGIILTPYIPKLISGEIPKGISIYILYLLNLGATVLSYWLFAYKNSLLQAHQRADVTSKVGLFTNTVQYMIQLIVLGVFHNYYLYVIAALFTQVLTNIVTAITATKMFPGYQPTGKLEKKTVQEINQRIKDLFTAKLGSVIVSAADTIVISAFLGLTFLAIYQNYYFILNSIYGMILVLFGAVTAGIGNSIVTESADKNYNDLEKFTFISCWLITICVCCFSVMYQPFMKIWVGEAMMLDDSYVPLFCIYFYVLTLSMVWATIKDAAGLWHYDRFRPLVGAMANLIMNLIMVNMIGIYGILLSTIISYVLISMPWMIYNLFSLLYKRKAFQYIKKLGLYILVCFASCVITVLLCSVLKMQGVLALLIYGMAGIVVSNTVQLICYRRMKEFKQSKALVLKLVKIR